MCLVIIFNHRYDENINVLRKIYGDRFERIIFLVPFYNGNDEDVIAVYGSSYTFQGFVAQAFSKLNKIKTEYFFFISDDMLLNPRLNEKNLLGELGIESSESLISGAIPLQECSFWPMARISNALMCFERYNGVNWKTELYDVDKAFHISADKGYKVFNLTISKKLKFTNKLSYVKHAGISEVKNFLSINTLPYPMWGGYSDFFLVPYGEMEVVAEKLGVMASMNVFVEIAIPTVIMLYCRSVKQLLETKYRNGTMWDENEIRRVENKYGCSLSAIFKDFPDNLLFYHPIKLSKWK